MDNRKKRNDLILIIVVLVIAITSFICLKLFSKEGAVAVVNVNGEEVARLPLSKDTVLDLETNVIVVENNYVYILSATCPDKVCVNEGKINSSGEIIVCLPNKLTVTVEGNADGDVDIR